MGLPWHATSVKVLTIVAYATQIEAYVVLNPLFSGNSEIIRDLATA